MIQIPRQLNNFRFIKTFRKNAIEKGWPIDPVRHQRLKNGTYKDKSTGSIYISNKQAYTGDMHSYSYQEMQKYINDIEKRDNRNVTYGVLAGYNGLIIVDVDDKTIAKKLLNIYPFSETFTVSSGGKELPHFYFKSQPYSKITRYDSSSKKRILDVQGASTYVIGPESTIRSNNETRKYRIINDEDVMEISYNDIIQAIEENIGEAYKIQKKEKNPYTDRYFLIDPISQEIFDNISCTDILAESGIDVSNNPGDTPFAESEGKRCLHRTGYLWFDHHTNTGGNVIQLYAKIHNIDAVKAKYDLADKTGVTEDIFRQAIQYQIKNQQHEMTELLCMRWMGSNPTYTIRDDMHRGHEIYIYNEGIYQANGKSYIKEYCNSILGKWYTSSLAEKIIDKIAVRTLIDSSDFFQEAPVEFIPVKNGILNIFEKKLYEFTPEMRFFSKLPVEYRQSEKCDVTLSHFKSVLTGDKDIQVMQELYGSLLLRDYRYQKAFMFYGEGSNGKGKTLEQIGALIGQDNYVNLSLQQLQNEKFQRCYLHQKLANLADDIGNARLEETQMFKQLTGGSVITTDRKHMSSITFKSHAKMIFSANKVPDTADDTDAFWRRWEMIGFNSKFVNEQTYKKMQEDGTLNDKYKIADINISEKLLDSKELSGVLNWALEGLARLIRNKGFSRTDSCHEVRLLWKRQVSSAIGFMQDNIIRTRNAEDYIIMEELYKTYIEYCSENNIESETEREFKKILQAENILCVRKRVAYGREWRWRGIKVRK